MPGDSSACGRGAGRRDEDFAGEREREQERGGGGHARPRPYVPSRILDRDAGYSRGSSNRGQGDWDRGSEFDQYEGYGADYYDGPYFGGGSYGGSVAGRGFSGGSREGERGAGTGRHGGKGPKGYRRSDERIYEDVCERLSRHRDLDATEVEVSVVNGEVSLSGMVDTRYAKRLAEDLAEEAAGVVDIHNRLQIRKEPPPGPDRVREGEEQGR